MIQGIRCIVYMHVYRISNFAKVVFQALLRLPTSMSCCWWSTRRHQLRCCSLSCSRHQLSRAPLSSVCRSAPMHTVEPMLTESLGRAIHIMLIE